MNKRANIIKQLFFTSTIVTAILVTACDRKEPKQKQAAGKELILYCAAGIRPPVAELMKIFSREHGVKIFTDYAGSEVLLSKIKLSHRGDLYIPGDKHYIEQALQEGMILSRRPVFYWVPTILVQKGNPKNISGLEDILQPGLKLGLGDPNACAIGRTSRQIFARNNITWEEIKKYVAYLSLTVNELGMQIQAKSLDAVIVWDAMAQYYGEYGDEVPIAPEKNLLSTVDVGVLKFTINRELAEKFVDFITSERGREVFKKYNYSTKPPK
jgi:molybdate transport system substrate-binding protein